MAPEKPRMRAWRMGNRPESRTKDLEGYWALHINSGTPAARAEAIICGHISISITKPQRGRKARKKPR